MISYVSKGTRAVTLKGTKAGYLLSLRQLQTIARVILFDKTQTSVLLVITGPL